METRYGSVVALEANEGHCTVVTEVITERLNQRSNLKDAPDTYRKAFLRTANFVTTSVPFRSRGSAGTLKFNQYLLT
jgi:hypothetical protein